MGFRGRFLFWVSATITAIKMKFSSPVIEYAVVCIGCEASGKSTFLQSWEMMVGGSIASPPVSSSENSPRVAPAPTPGAKVWRGLPGKKGFEFAVTEVGGSGKLPEYWPHYYRGKHALVVCIDLSGVSENSITSGSGRSNAPPPSPDAPRAAISPDDVAIDVGDGLDVTEVAGVAEDSCSLRDGLEALDVALGSNTLLGSAPVVVVLTKRPLSPRPMDSNVPTLPRDCAATLAAHSLVDGVFSRYPGRKYRCLSVDCHSEPCVSQTEAVAVALTDMINSVLDEQKKSLK